MIILVLMLPNLAKATLVDGVDAYAKKEYQKAYGYFLPLAENGNQYAQYGLAKMYELGQGLTVNNEKAYYWYQKAANQQYGIAQNNVGLFYQFGKGVEVDLKQAKNWFQLACNNRCTEGCKNLQRLAFDEESTLDSY